MIQSGYNNRGKKIGTTNANGNTQAIILDAAGQETERVLGDGLVVRKQKIDALQRRESHTDARGYVWRYQYNHLNGILQIEYPSTLTTKYAYNELNHRTRDTDQSGLSTSYDYDALNNISTRYSPSGLQTVMVFDRNHQMIEITNPDDSSMTWTRNYFSVELGHVDLGGESYSNTYDFKGQITRHFSTNTARMNYGGAVVYFSFPPEAWQIFQISKWEIPTTDISFQYDAGRLTLVTDSARTTGMIYEYDSENRQTAIFSEGRVIHSEIDALGKIVFTYNSGATVSIVCDANRNRRHVVVNCGQTIDAWYEYDKSERVIFDGVTNLTLIYKAGFRVQQTKNGKLDATYVYDQDGRLVDANYYQLPGVPGEVATHRDFTLNGKLTNYTESGPYSYQHQITYTVDKNEWVCGDYQTLDGLLSNTRYSGFSPMGLPVNQHTDYKDGISDEMTNYYDVSYEDHKLTRVVGSRTDKYGQGKVSTATKSYGPNGVVSIMGGLEDSNSNDPSGKAITTKSFGSTFDGKILWRETVTGSESSNFPGFLSGTGTSSSNYYDTHGNLIASNGTDPVNPDANGMTLNYMQHVSNQFGSQFKAAKTAENKAITNFEAQAHAQHLSLPDFTQTFPAQTPDKYTVASGDSCTSIAQRLYGDASFGAAIAAANAVAVDEALFIGQILDLPQYLPNTNNIDDNTPYDTFMRIMVGNLYPHLDLKQPPPPPKPHHSGGWLGGIVGEVVHAVVDVVAAVVGFVYMGGPAGAALLVSLADAAFQEVTTGSVNVMQALVAGVEAGISAGVMSAAGSAAGAATTGAGAAAGTAGSTSIGAALGTATSLTLQQAVTAAGEIAVADQLVEMAAGMRPKFDFDSVLEAMGTAAVMHGVTPAEDSALGVDSKSFAGSVINSETGGLIGGELNSVVEHQKFDIAATAAQALGSAIGSEIGGEVKAEIQSKQTETANAYNQAKQASASASSSQQAQGQNSQNPGRNPNGLFAGSNKNNNQTSTSKASNQQQSNDNSSWLTEDPKKRLEDAGVDLPDSDENSSLTNVAHTALGMAATGAGVGEFSKATNTMWKGSNSMWYNKSWGGNQYTGGRTSVIEDADRFNLAGRFFYAADTALNVIEIREDLLDGNIAPIGPTAFDIIVGGVGIAGGPIGFALATTYFAGEAIVNNWDTIETAIDETSEVNQVNQEITGSGIWERAKFQ